MQASDQSARMAYGHGRITAARRALAEAATVIGRAFTIEELAEAARSIEPSAGSTATAYRAAAIMEENGFLERVGDRHGRALYEHCAVETHHHHIVCESCGKTARAHCPITASLGDSVAASGFVLTRHVVTLYGLCPDCANREGC